MPKIDSSNGKAVKITEVRTYTPLSHNYADLFANLVSASELCAATEELWRIPLRDSYGLRSGLRLLAHG